MTNSMITSNVIQIIESYILNKGEYIGIMIVPRQDFSGHAMWLYNDFKPVEKIDFDKILAGCTLSMILKMAMPLIKQYKGLAPEYIDRFIKKYCAEKGYHLFYLSVETELCAFSYKGSEQVEQISIDYILGTK